MMPVKGKKEERKNRYSGNTTDSWALLIACTEEKYLNVAVQADRELE
jgi:hypothetical protein